MRKTLEKALKILKSGGVIAFPTETVFGIGAALDQPQAIKQIFKIKNRPKNKPLQVLVATMQQAKKLGKFNMEALKFAQENWPGPTLVVKKTGKVPKIVTGGGSTVGLRMPDHQVALALIKKCGPIVATSANRSGKKPALNAKEVNKQLPEIDYILSGRVTSGKPSKVIDLSKGLKVLRA
ncbi:MAG: threonylcarbamoyl-AMP synthase [Candidatus Margulisbacteria bacterium]|nr:threonylcarbamoyl-AMP synthase [Candidatus Margulisiibacteriota bacterium]